jgi:hypothetical protein
MTYILLSLADPRLRLSEPECLACKDKSSEYYWTVFIVQHDLLLSLHVSLHLMFLSMYTRYKQNAFIYAYIVACRPIGS